MTNETMVPSSEKNAKKTTLSGTKLVRIAGAVLLAAVLLAIGIVPRMERNREALAAVHDSAVTHPVISVIHPEQGPPKSELVLPGNIQPLYTANVYARVDGYVDRRNVDIGAKVKAGQVLAVISAPEIDQQLLQARATVTQSQAALQQAMAALAQAKANAELARLTKERDVPLGAQRAISQQTVDEVVQAYNARVADIAAANANIAAAEANIKANQANVARLEQMQGFERVLAPFDGVITARNVERGDLVAAGSAGSKQLFSIAQSGTLRIQIDVPQSEAVNIQDGQKAALDVSERAGRAYTGTVVRSASSLDAAARTMLTEVQVDNRDGSLLPGMYAQVKFELPRAHTALIIPTSLLVVDKNGMHVVSVTSEGRIHMLPVKIGEDMGTHLEIVDGLSGNESLVPNPSDLLSEGQQVEVK